MSWKNKLAVAISKKYPLTISALEGLINKIIPVYVSGVASGQCGIYKSTAINANSVINYIKEKTGILTAQIKTVMDNLELNSYGGFVPSEIINGKINSTLDNILNPVSKIGNTVTAPILKIVIPVAVIAVAIVVLKFTKGKN